MNQSRDTKRTAGNAVEGKGATQTKQKRVALAFQGGGFAAGAIGAGVVRALVEHKIFDGPNGQKLNAFEEYAIDAFSGTSAGALVASVCWSLSFENKAIEKAPETLRKQWLHLASGLIPNARVARLIKWTDSFARLNPLYDQWVQQVRVPYVRDTVMDWMKAYIPIDELREEVKRRRQKGLHVPGLALGATEMLRGELKTFSADDFSLEAMLASGSLADINGITTIEEGNSAGTYLDGYWGRNPPLKDLTEHQVNEIWLVEVYPKTRGEIPRTLEQRLDRKEELSQNSLVEQELDDIQRINRWLKSDGTSKRPRLNNSDGKYRHIEVERLPMLLDLPTGTSIVNSPSFIKSMMDYGYHNACAFLDRKRQPIGG